MKNVTDRFVLAENHNGLRSI